jgi:AcrR family transcriptional regulator
VKTTEDTIRSTGPESDEGEAGSCDDLDGSLWDACHELPLVGAWPRERADAARNRRRILVAAERLVDRHGVGEVSMDAIAAEAQVGKGTLFRRFGDRAGLARALIDERERRFQDEFIRGAPPLGPGSPPVERLVAFGRRMLELLDGHGEIIAAAETGPPAARMRSAPYAAYRTHIATLLRKADPGLDADVLADALLGALSAGLFLHLRDDRGVAVARMQEGWEQLARRLLAPC